MRELSIDHYHRNRITLGKYFVEYTYTPKYRCSFIQWTNMPLCLLIKIFVNVRISKIDMLYLPYYIADIFVNRGCLYIKGVGMFTEYNNQIILNNK